MPLERMDIQSPQSTSKPTGLIFIDTNIWLDFYRSRTEAGITLLKHVEAIADRVIVGPQVEMEFKKNRQATILEAINSSRNDLNPCRNQEFSLMLKQLRLLKRTSKEAMTS